jgi:hypothetical protein
MKKFILSLIFISLISSQVLAFQGSDNLEVIKKNAALQLMRNHHHNSERIKIPNPFQFDYKKKKEKTTVRSYQIEPGNRDPIEVKINGEDQATIVQGDDFILTIYFSDGCSEANINVWADMNGNGIWEDAIDMMILDMEDEIVDNDFYPMQVFFMLLKIQAASTLLISGSIRSHPIILFLARLPRQFQML